MAASSLQNKNLPTQARLLTLFAKQYPALTFKVGQDFAWSPKSQTVTYIQDTKNEPLHLFALVHEIAHADLGHNTYEDDFNLLQLEVAAWERAKEIGTPIGVAIDEDHVQDCLDTYRNWLHSRAKCPACGVVSLQLKDGSYTCYNCRTSWKVPKSQLCRVSRRVIR